MKKYTIEQIQEYIDFQVDYNENHDDSHGNYAELLPDDSTMHETHWVGILLDMGIPVGKTEQCIIDLLDSNLIDVVLESQYYTPIDNYLMCIPFQEHQISLPDDFEPTEEHKNEFCINGSNGSYYAYESTDKMLSFYVTEATIKQWLIEND